MAPRVKKSTSKGKKEVSSSSPAANVAAANIAAATPGVAQTHHSRMRRTVGAELRGVGNCAGTAERGAGVVAQLALLAEASAPGQVAQVSDWGGASTGGSAACVGQTTPSVVSAARWWRLVERS
ncbi:uncharacterized protein A4U43_C09F9230 [Asparagus officinalis]|uniref:Uncharacterized protein n=1 Tax=Asparagus officinalis TaxID=4686 RepID=A0A5P1E9N0_ASPOF|nr:uncharacterized protein A4U43_C09F9230 [Asparagus officinalis]